MAVAPSKTGCPACGAPCEREEEDGLLKWVCMACQYEFGFIQVSQEADCQLGVPEAVRLAGSNVDIPVPEFTDAGRAWLGLPTVPDRSHRE